MSPTNAARKCSLFLLLILTAQPAHAYIDPGTGMLAIQGLIALLVGVIGFVRNPIQWIRHRVAQWRDKKRGDA